MEVCQLHAPSVLFPGKNPNTNWTEGLVGPRIGPDDFKRTTFFGLCWNRNPDHSSRSPVTVPTEIPRIHPNIGTLLEQIPPVNTIIWQFHSHHNENIYFHMISLTSHLCLGLPYRRVPRNFSAKIPLLHSIIPPQIAHIGNNNYGDDDDDDDSWVQSSI